MLGDPALQDPGLECGAGRRAAHDAIDAAITAWTRNRGKDEAAETLQARGIPAGPVCRPPDIPADPQLAARGFLQPVHHRGPVLGEVMHLHATLPWWVDGHMRASLSDPKGEGADNARVLKRWLGMGVGQVRRLEATGALRPERPLLPRERVGRPNDRQPRPAGARQ